MGLALISEIGSRADFIKAIKPTHKFRKGATIQTAGRPRAKRAHYRPSIPSYFIASYRSHMAMMGQFPHSAPVFNKSNGWHSVNEPSTFLHFTWLALIISICITLYILSVLIRIYLGGLLIHLHRESPAGAAYCARAGAYPCGRAHWVRVRAADGLCFLVFSSSSLYFFSVIALRFYCTAVPRLLVQKISSISCPCLHIMLPPYTFILNHGQKYHPSTVVAIAALHCAHFLNAVSFATIFPFV